MTRSNASVVISVTSASPPATLIPTLLCSTSTLPHRFMHSPTAAWMLVSSVTSACQARASPPSRRMRPAVSSAETGSRSTASTRAPSRANRSAVARPLPMAVPGVCPAPMTIAVLPSSRMAFLRLWMVYPLNHPWETAARQAP